MNDFYVYILFRPNGKPCYVGKGRGDRVKVHFRRALNPHLKAIIEGGGGELPHSMASMGLSEKEAFAMEVELIKEIGRKANGGPLVNMTDGGEGVTGGRHTAEWKAKMSLLMKGRKASDEAKARMSAAQKIITQTPERRRMISLLRKGAINPPEMREKISQTLKAKGIVPPSRAGIPSTPEANQKRSETLKRYHELRRSAAGQNL